MNISVKFLILFLFLGCSFASGQVTTIYIKGNITDENHNPLTGVSVVDIQSGKGVSSDENGHYILKISAERSVDICFSLIGYKKDTINLSFENSDTILHDMQLKPEIESIDAVIVESVTNKAGTLELINIIEAQRIPLLSGNIESVLPTLGASARNEMSAQYSVRGGNYDENLIYVNDIEIYRPLMVKSGQQEGLSFINTDLTSSVQFAAGGFDAKYGDKMSSVLDIKYKRPVSYSGGGSISLLGGAVHLEGVAARNKITYIAGFRYKTNQYLLKSMQTKGDFNPRFIDFQTFITWNITDHIELDFLGNIARNKYQVIPRSRKTSFGTYQQSLNFTVYYEGQEVDYFNTTLGALSLGYHPNNQLSLKLTTSLFNTYEAITYDILGEYWINLLDNTIGSATAGDSILNIGVGGNLTHARNYIDAQVVDISHKGSYTWKQHTINWGMNIQTADFSEKIREWELIDSAGYSVPYSGDEIHLNKSVIANNSLISDRYTGYLQYTTLIRTGKSDFYVNAGARFIYLDNNRQFIVSPRIGLRYIPSFEKNIEFHAAYGWYHQPPFFKEMRDPDGKMHTDIKAQESVHYVLGCTYYFSMWERPFRFTSELYYKKLKHLIPYTIDDVDIQYLPQYEAEGYTAGIEFKINGEFVKDAESWASLSFLTTKEDRLNDEYGQYPRPTDQLINFGLYFQDYFPNNPSYKIHLNLYYGSRLPYTSTDYDMPEDYFHLSSYKRIDIGLSKSLIMDKTGQKKKAPLFINDLWFSAEVFNLFGFKNQASYQWVRTVNNQEGYPNVFAVPNYLTGRVFNFRLTVDF